MAESIITLNEQQEEALKQLIAFCDDECEAWAARVSGYAGTGKSTTIQKLVGEVRGPVYFTAPTHKAVKVLAAMARREGLQVETMTIHSLLGLKVKEDEEKEKLEQDSRANQKLDKARIVVVDECSMISADLFGYIERGARVYGVKFIFLGDPAQLPPVGEDHSKTFDVEGATLTQVMRQRGDNPILGLCTDLREAWAVGEYRLPRVVPSCSEDGGIGLHVMSGQYFREYMPHAFSHEKFDGNHDRFRVIAWSNKAVDEYNGFIQRLRYPGIKTPFAEGEPIAFSKACAVRAQVGSERGNWWDGELDDIAVTTEMEGVVTGINQMTHEKFKDLPGTWAVSVDLEDGKSVRVWTLDRIGWLALNSLLEHMAAKCRTKEMRWFEFWMTKRAFAVIRPAYAMTAHKSQGSTFENVFVDAENIWRNQNKEEAMQCLYVACSRASHHLILNASGIL